MVLVVVIVIMMMLVVVVGDDGGSGGDYDDVSGGDNAHGVSGDGDDGLGGGDNDDGGCRFDPSEVEQRASISLSISLSPLILSVFQNSGKRFHSLSKNLEERL